MIQYGPMGKPNFSPPEGIGKETGVHQGEPNSKHGKASDLTNPARYKHDKDMSKGRAKSVWL